MDNEYYILDKLTAIDYVRQNEKLEKIFSAEENLVCEEIGDGNLNLIFVVRSEADPEKSILIKQAPPYMRRFTDEKLSIERAFFEAAYYEQVSKICPEFIPSYKYYDKKLAVIVMENLDRHVILRSGLIARNKYPLLAEHMGTFLARVLYSTSDFHLDSQAKKEQVKRLINPDMCIVTEWAVFNEPYVEDAKDNHWNPRLDSLVKEIRHDEELLSHVRMMEYGFRTKAQALIHGDLWGGIMVNEKETKVIDPEFCFYGPMGFDIGALIGNYLLDYAAQAFRIENEAERVDYQNYLLNLVSETWNIFSRKFIKQWNEERNEISAPRPFMERFMLDLLKDVAGFAGCKMIRRIIGSAHVEDLDGIDDLQKQASAMKLGISIGKKILMEREAIAKINDLNSMARSMEIE